MDAKGIAWVGRLYQKFETMCLEVEDIICQDTVKYVENQVEVVGASVKRFYSDVVQDLLPPAELNDEKKVAVCSSALEKYENVVIVKKPVRGMKIERSKADEEKFTANLKVTTDTKRYIVHKLPRRDNHANSPLLASSPYSASSAQIDGYSRKKDDDNIRHKLDLTKGCESLTETTTTILEKKSANEVSSCCVISNRQCEASSELPGNIGTMLSVEDARCDSLVQSSKETGIESDNVSSSKSIGDDKMETRPLSYGDSSAELDGRSGSWSLDEIEHEATVLEHVTDEIQQADEMKLDEACVLVNGVDFPFDSNEEVEHRTYKKKIAGAFSFTKKSKRKQEYKELALKHGYGSSTFPNEQHEQKLLTEDVSEHDWQLL
ncbi:hypothetical protein SDJN03_02083, partial [Cucurbita argyrosperma subsp. sororia]